MSHDREVTDLIAVGELNAGFLTGNLRAEPLENGLHARLLSGA
jgi:hypothetical protein